MTAIAILVSIFVAILLPLILTSKRWGASEERLHARRIADAKMNARLLRFNL